MKWVLEELRECEVVFGCIWCDRTCSRACIRTDRGLPKAGRNATGSHPDIACVLSSLGCNACTRR